MASIPETINFFVNHGLSFLREKCLTNLIGQYWLYKRTKVDTNLCIICHVNFRYIYIIFLYYIYYIYIFMFHKVLQSARSTSCRVKLQNDLFVYAKPTSYLVMLIFTNYDNNSDNWYS